MRPAGPLFCGRQPGRPWARSPSTRAWRSVGRVIAGSAPDVAGLDCRAGWGVLIGRGRASRGAAACSIPADGRRPPDAPGGQRKAPVQESCTGAEANERRGIVSALAAYLRARLPSVEVA